MTQKCVCLLFGCFGEKEKREMNEDDSALFRRMQALSSPSPSSSSSPPHQTDDDLLKRFEALGQTPSPQQPHLLPSDCFRNMPGAKDDKTEAERLIAEYTDLVDLEKERDTMSLPISSNPTATSSSPIPAASVDPLEARLAALMGGDGSSGGSSGGSGSGGGGSEKAGPSQGGTFGNGAKRWEDMFLDSETKELFKTRASDTKNKGLHQEVDSLLKESAQLPKQQTSSSNPSPPSPQSTSPPWHPPTSDDQVQAVIDQVLDEVVLEAEGGPALGADVTKEERREERRDDTSDEEDSDEEWRKMEEEKKRRDRGFFRRLLPK